jgi:hypothetical protein
MVPVFVLAIFLAVGPAIAAGGALRVRVGVLLAGAMMAVLLLLPALTPREARTPVHAEQVARAVASIKEKWNP